MGIKYQKKTSKSQLQKCHVGHTETDQTTNTEFLYFPGQVLCFIAPEPGINHAIIKCCHFDFKRGSVFSNLWKQEYVNSTQRGNKRPFICHIDVEAIISHVLMIPSNEKEETYHQIWDKNFWGNEFY